jgi:hypothetical protein
MHMTRTMLRIMMALGVLALFPNAARANALSDSWQCAKNAGMTAGSVGSDLYKKGEALAKDAGPLAICLAKSGPEGQALAVTSSALTALRLAKPSLLPKGQCEPRIKGVAAKPFGQGIAAVMPSGNAKTNLLSALNSPNGQQLMWGQLSAAPPPFSMVPNQIECGCLISDGALTLSDISEITNAVAKTSASCGAMLDSLGLGFINDIGSYAGKLAKSLANGASGKLDEWVGGQTDPDPPGVTFERYFGKRLKSIAANMATNPTNWQSKGYFDNGGDQCSYNMNSGQWSGNCNPTLDQLAAQCANYYDNHKMSLSNGKKACNSYKDTVIAAATPLGKRYAGEIALPGLYLSSMKTWIDDEWLWRLPMRGGFINDDGTIGPGGKWTNFEAQTLFVGTLGQTYGVKANATPGEDYKSTGVLTTARTILSGVQFDPNVAMALAFAGAEEPVRDKVRETWEKSRRSYTLVQLQEWYPKPAVGNIYGCSTGLAKECAAAMEARFDKSCFKPMSELYLTGPSIKGQTGLAFVARLNEEKKKCMAVLAPVLPAAQKLSAGLDAHVKSQCPVDRAGAMDATCASEKSKAYRDCATIALKAGKDNVGQCLSARKLGTDILEQLQKGLRSPPAPAPTPPAPEPRRCAENGVTRC